MKAFYLVKFLSLNIIDRIDLLQFLERIDFHDILLTDRLYNDLVIFSPSSLFQKEIPTI